MRLQKKVKVNTYSCEVVYVLADDIYKVERDLYKKYGGDKPKDNDPSEGYTVTVSSSLYYVVLDWRFLGHNLIAHELYHATHRIAGDRDIEDEESRAWICGFLTEEFYKFLNTDKVKRECDKLTEKILSQDGGEPTKLSESK